MEEKKDNLMNQILAPRNKIRYRLSVRIEILVHDFFKYKELISINELKNTLLEGVK